MAPDGTAYGSWARLQTAYEHEPFAEKLLGTTGPPSPLDQLMEAGWARLFFTRDRIYLQVTGVPTQAQLLAIGRDARGLGVAYEVNGRQGATDTWQDFLATLRPVAPQRVTPSLAAGATLHGNGMIDLLRGADDGERRSSPGAHPGRGRPARRRGVPRP